MKTLVILLLLGAPALATDSDTTVPYRWGEFKAVKYRGKDRVILEPWSTVEGRRRLERSRFRTDFYQLAHHYQPQLTPVYAGVATLAMILNAYRLPKHLVPSQKEQEIAKPKALGGGTTPFPAYNQLNVLTEATDRVKDRAVLGMKNVTPENENDKGAFKPGTSLDELKGLFGVYGVTGLVTAASQPPAEGIKTFRRVVREVTTDPERFLVVNFKGDLMGASTEGTVSPIAAYDTLTDSVLILDVTAHKNPWYWAPLDALYGAMNTQYGEGTWRGWLVVSDPR